MSGFIATVRSRIATPSLGRTVIVAAGMIAFLAFPVLAQDGTGPMPENAEARNYGGGWNCALGYRVNGEECVAIDMPENAYATGRTYGSGWACRRGYEDAGGTSCAAIPVPDNAFLRSSGYDWQCDRGYRQDRETCVPIVLPDNAYLIRRHHRLRMDLRARVHGQFKRLRSDCGSRERLSHECGLRCRMGLRKRLLRNRWPLRSSWHFQRTPFWTRRPTGRDGAVSGDLRTSTPSVSRSTFRQMRISIDPETHGAAIAAFKLRMGSAFLDDSAPRPDHGDAPGIRMRIGCRLKYRLTQPTPTHRGAERALLALRRPGARRLSGDARPVCRSKVIATVSETGARGWWRRLASSPCPPTEFSGIADCPIRSRRMRRRLAVQDLPAETLVYLLGSRYCDTDHPVRGSVALVREHAARLVEGAGDL